MNANTSVFVICVETMIYLFLTVPLRNELIYNKQSRKTDFLAEQKIAELKFAN